MFLTGSDTSSNALFCSLQQATAHQLGVPGDARSGREHDGRRDREDDLAAVDRGRLRGDGLVGKESELFRFTVRHSLLFAVIVG